MRLSTTSLFKEMSMNGTKFIELTEKELNNLKEVIIEIAEDVISICEENNLSYHLTGGSALGAIRHGGFIPWDDDLDIDLERKDVEVFIEKFNFKFSNKYWIHYYKSDEQFCIPNIQVRLKGTCIRGILDSNIEEAGAYIDIAIIENTYNNFLLRKMHGIGSMALGLFVSCRRFYRDRKYLMQIAGENKELQKIFKIKIRIGSIISILSLYRWTNLYNTWNAQCNNINSKWVSVPTGRKHFFGEMYKRGDFCENQKVKFENHYWCIPKEINKYLTHMYGDYMKIPPIEKREKHILLDFNLGKYKKE